MLYVGFVIVYGITAAFLMDPYTRDERQFTEDSLSGWELYTQPKITDVSSSQVFWEYIDNTFFPALYSAQSLGQEEASVPYPRVDPAGANRLVGDILFFTQRVQVDATCSVVTPFSATFDKCYPPHARAETGSYGPSDEFVFTDSATVPTLPSVGKFDMNSGGYFQAISSDATVARSQLDQLRAKNWLDAQSRGVLISLTMYNPNLQLFESAQIFFAISPSSFWKPPLVVTHTFQRSLTPSIFSSPTFLPLFVLLCFFVVVFLVYLVMAIAVSHNKAATVWTNGLLICITGLLIATVIALATLSFSLDGAAQSRFVSESDRTSQSAFAYFVNSANFAFQLDVIRVIMSVNLVLIFLHLVVQIGHILLLPSLRMLGVVLGFLVGLGVAVSLITAQAGPLVPWPRFADSLLFLVFSLLGMADWSPVITSSAAGPFLLISFFAALVFLAPLYLWAGLVHSMTHYRETSKSIDRQLEDVLAQFRHAVHEYYEYLLFEKFNLDDFFKKYLPGLYYRVIVAEKRFKKKVEDAISAKSAKRNRRTGMLGGRSAAAGTASTHLDVQAAKLQAEDQFRANVVTLNSAAEQVRDRIAELDASMSDEIGELARKIAEIDKYITLLDRKLSI